jgi:hypothetical protein
VVGGGTGLGEGQLAYIVGFSGTCAGTASLVVKAGVIISCP